MEQDCGEKASRIDSKNRRDEELRVHLLRYHVPAKGDEPLEGDRCEISAVSALRLRPDPHRGNHARYRGPQEIQKTEISADRLDTLAVFGAFRAELQELHDAREVLSRSGPGDPGDILHLGRKNLLRGHSDERAAVKHEELQE